MRTTLLALYATASAATAIDMDYMSALQDAITKLQSGARSYRYKQREAIETTTFTASEIERVHSQDQCEAGYRFDVDSCTCHAIRKCYTRCPSGYLKNPLVQCGCVSYDSFQELYNHDLDENCSLPHLLKRANAVLSQEDDWVIGFE